MSGDPEQEYFADGLTEDIITGLSQQQWFFVIARNSSFTYKGEAVDVRQVASELGVRYILEGSVRKAANRVRVTGQLIDATPGNHLWAERYDRELSDIFELQDEITNRVIGSVEPADPARRGGARAAQAAAEHRRLGPGDAGAAAHVAHDHRRTSARAGAAAARRSRSIPTMLTRMRCSAGPMSACSISIPAGRFTNSPIGRSTPARARSRSTIRIRGAIWCLASRMRGGASPSRR